MNEISTELKSHFLRLYQMAFSDDNFDVLEMQMLYKFAEERGVNKNDLNDILLHPSIETAIPETVEERIEFLYDLSVMIWADKKVTDDERVTLEKYCLKFGFVKENITELCDFLLDKAQKGISKLELLELIND